LRQSLEFKFLSGLSRIGLAAIRIIVDRWDSRMFSFLRGDARIIASDGGKTWAGIPRLCFEARLAAFLRL
jgi:hypothetical protein